MKKHDVNYHDHDNLILFYLKHCNHLKLIKHSFSQRIKKKIFFSKEKLFDQSEVEIQNVKNKKLLIFLEKINNSKMILKKSTLIEFNEKLIEHFKKLNKH